MGKKSGKKLSAERLEKLKALGRRKYLLKKEAAGTITKDERTELASMPPPKQGRPATSAVEQPDVDTEVERPQDDAVATPDGGAVADDATAPPPAPRVVPEPAPSVRVLPSAAAGNWRSKYQQKIGREGVCRGAAELWCAGLNRLIAWIATDGTRPILSPNEVTETIFPAAVLVADQLLPPRLEMSAELEVCAGSGMIIGQAVVVKRRRDKLAKAKPAEPALRSVPFDMPKPPVVMPPPVPVRAPDATPVPPAPPEESKNPTDEYRV